MTIKGLTDYNAKNDRRVIGRIEVKVFKGARKGSIERNGKTIPVAGKNLGEYYRIVTDNLHAKRILKEAYGAPDENGDFITDTINVYFPFDEPERTFNTSMKSYSASKLLRICDREFISMESGTVTDAKGNVHNVQNQCQKPCPVAGKQFSEKCPLGCSQQGEFLFYIRELFDADMMVPAQLTVHAFNDITYISDKLDQFLLELGSITNSHFPSFKTRHKIPFILTKSKIKGKRPVFENGKRTGKNAEKEDWMIAFDPDTEWMNLRRNWEYTEQLKNMQVSLPAQVAVKLLRGENINEAELLAGIQHPQPPILQAAESTDPLPALPPQSGAEKISKEEWIKVQKIFSAHKWGNEEIKKAIFSTFNVSRIGEIDRDLIPQIEKLASDPVQKEYWSIDLEKVLDTFYDLHWEEGMLEILLEEEFGVKDINDLASDPHGMHTLITIAKDEEKRRKYEDLAKF